MYSTSDPGGQGRSPSDARHGLLIILARCGKSLCHKELRMIRPFRCHVAGGALDRLMDSDDERGAELERFGLEESYCDPWVVVRAVSTSVNED